MNAPLIPSDEHTFLVTQVVAATPSDEGSVVALDLAVDGEARSVRLVVHASDLTMLLDQLQMARIHLMQAARKHQSH